MRWLTVSWRQSTGDGFRKQVQFQFDRRFSADAIAGKARNASKSCLRMGLTQNVVWHGEGPFAIGARIKTESNRIHPHKRRLLQQARFATHSSAMLPFRETETCLLQAN